MGKDRSHQLQLLLIDSSHTPLNLPLPRYKKAVDKEGQPLPPKVQAKLVWPQGSDK